MDACFVIPLKPKEYLLLSSDFFSFGAPQFRRAFIQRKDRWFQDHRATRAMSKQGECTSPEKTDTEIWLTNTVSGLTRTLHFIQGRNPA
jgi:hypothetical protein